MTKETAGKQTIIQREREAKGWSPAQFANWLGCHFSSVSLWESRKRKPSKAQRVLISQLFGTVTADEIAADYPARKLEK